MRCELKKNLDQFTLESCFIPLSYIPPLFRLSAQHLCVLIRLDRDVLIGRGELFSGSGVSATLKK